MEKTITVNCSLENFKNQDGNSIAYVKLTSNVLGITIKLKPADATTAQILKSYLASK